MLVEEMSTDKEYKIVTNVPYGLKGNSLNGLTYFGKVNSTIASTYADIRGIYQEHIRDNGTNIEDYDFLLMKSNDEWFVIMVSTIVAIDETAAEIHVVITNGSNGDIPKLKVLLKKLGLESTITIA